MDVLFLNKKEALSTSLLTSKGVFASLSAFYKGVPHATHREYKPHKEYNQKNSSTI